MKKGVGFLSLGIFLILIFFSLVCLNSLSAINVYTVDYNSTLMGVYIEDASDLYGYEINFVQNSSSASSKFYNLLGSGTAQGSGSKNNIFSVYDSILSPTSPGIDITDSIAFNITHNRTMILRAGIFVYANETEEEKNFCTETLSCGDWGACTGGVQSKTCQSLRCLYDDSVQTQGCTDSSCFPAGTKILMANGENKNIEDVRVGEYVKSFDENFNLVNSKVLELEQPIHYHYYSIIFDDFSQLNVTQEHPIYIKSGNYAGWGSISKEATNILYPNIPVKQINLGDYVLNSNKIWKKVISLKYHPGKIQTYNLKTIEDSHAFFADNIFVHNKCTETAPSCSNTGSHACGVSFSESNCAGECSGIGTGQTCGTGKTCSSGSCINTCTNVCISGTVDKSCAGSNRIRTRTCSDSNEDGCPEWGSYSESACMSGYTCSAGECIPPICVENWQCGDWGNCVSGFQTRTCSDLNSCGRQDSVETQTCVVPDCTKNSDCTSTNTCSVGTCSLLGKCTYANTQNSCNDDNPCTIRDVCSSGSCSGVEKTCSIGYVCESLTGDCVQGEKPDDEDIPDDIVKISSSHTCTSNFACSGWSKCSAEYNMFSLILSDSISGIMSRSCTDINQCYSNFLETKNCTLKEEVTTETKTWCNQTYIEIRNSQNRVIARVQAVNGNYVNVNLNVQGEGSCYYCYDKKQNFDETGVDCGGDSCASCAELETPKVLSGMSSTGFGIVSAGFLFFLSSFIGLSVSAFKTYVDVNLVWKFLIKLLIWKRI